MPISQCQNPNHVTLAIHHLVDLIVNAAKLIVKQYAHVFQLISEAHLVVARNVLLVLNVRKTRLV